MGAVVSDSGVPPLKLPDVSEKDATQGLPNQEDDKATGAVCAKILSCVQATCPIQYSDASMAASDRSGTYHPGGSGLLCDHCDECAAFQCDTCGIM